jgi:PadR family transcriptional regulator, regulatory protein PadR
METLIGCPCTGQTLDKLVQPAILAVLAETPLHGYAVADRIASLPSFAGAKPDVSGIYRFLKAMERRGLVSSSWDTSESGPAKKTYQITVTGHRCLCRWVQTLEQYRDALTSLLSTARKAVRK